MSPKATCNPMQKNYFQVENIRKTFYFLQQCLGVLKKYFVSYFLGKSLESAATPVSASNKNKTKRFGRKHNKHHLLTNESARTPRITTFAGTFRKER